METLYVPLEFREDTSNASPGLLSGVLMRYEERASTQSTWFWDLFKKGAKRPARVIREQRVLLAARWHPDP